MTIIEKYADLLINYCVEAQPGERIFVASTFLAEPLLREVYRAGLRAGASLEFDLDFRGKSNIFFAEATGDQLAYLPTLKKKAFDEFDGYLFIRAPYNLRESQNWDSDKTKIRQQATAPLMEQYFKRTATRELKRNLCQYPTQAAAQEAGMSLEDYEHFVFNACRLFDEDPKASWLEVRRSQQEAVDLLNSCNSVRYVGDKTDIEFSTKGRIWMNSDGQTNMPSGEVYTSPVEDSVNGHIYFPYAFHGGNELTDIILEVKDGLIEKWDATTNKEYLDKIFDIDGARRFGEAAIGTNYQINRFTKNILFDEKIGGTIHMAVGQSYLQTGGKNKSSVHWDMIKPMQQGGAIYADGRLIYENGQFL